MNDVDITVDFRDVLGDVILFLRERVMHKELRSLRQTCKKLKEMTDRTWTVLRQYDSVLRELLSRVQPCQSPPSGRFLTWGLEVWATTKTGQVDWVTQRVWKWTNTKTSLLQRHIRFMGWE
jgi:hypothetical protein